MSVLHGGTNVDLLTIPEVAKRTRLGKSTVYLMAQRGELPVIRFGTAVRIPADALDRWLRERIDQPPAAVVGER
jgi:excisionase family DNA binding protein